MGHNHRKKGKGQVSLLMALLLTTGAAVTAFAVSGVNATNASEENTTLELPEDSNLNLSVRMSLPQNLTRGDASTEAEFHIFVTNEGNTTVEIVIVDWILSPGFETVAMTSNCTGLVANNTCVATLIVNSTLDVPLGLNQVRGEVRYG